MWTEAKCHHKFLLFIKFMEEMEKESCGDVVVNKCPYNLCVARNVLGAFIHKIILWSLLKLLFLNVLCSPASPIALNIGTELPSSTEVCLQSKVDWVSIE